MTVSLLELERARRALEDFCERRNLSAGACLRCTQDGDELFVHEGDSPQTPNGKARPLIRLCYREGQWLLFSSSGTGQWAVYPHLPRADSVQQVVEELEQAPLHVHWG